MSARTNKNLKAFSETMESYEQRKYRSMLSAQDAANDSHGTVNLARPSASDFVCDVEKAISSVVSDEAMLAKCIRTFLLGKEELSKNQQNYYEQRIGSKFIGRGIWPKGDYFNTIRRGHEKAQER